MYRICTTDVSWLFLQKLLSQKPSAISKIRYRRKNSQWKLYVNPVLTVDRYRESSVILKLSLKFGFSIPLTGTTSGWYFFVYSLNFSLSNLLRYLYAFIGDECFGKYFCFEVVRKMRCIWYIYMILIYIYHLSLILLISVRKMWEKKSLEIEVVKLIEGLIWYI